MFYIHTLTNLDWWAKNRREEKSRINKSDPKSVSNEPSNVEAKSSLNPSHILPSLSDGNKLAKLSRLVANGPMSEFKIIATKELGILSIETLLSSKENLKETRVRRIHGSPNCSDRVRWNN
jgi:hypothetical protein